MKLSQVACQLYTLRNQLQNAKDIASTLKKVKAIGYQAVQPSGLGPISDDELAAILKGEGLVCCATHEPGEILLSNPESVVIRLKKLDCKITSYPWPGGVSFNTLADVKKFAAQLNHSGRVFKEAGITFCYHNHHMEFRRIGGKTVLEILLEETDPSHLKFELDTYWVQFGGGDPVDWCQRLKGRLANLHMKDYAINSEYKVVFAEVGNGNLNWPAILRAAEESGCRWFCVEQDECPGNPLDSVQMSYEFVNKNLCDG